jgi:peptidyl-prolyl cis-trans isomerase B (cyclophilin B)
VTKEYSVKRSLLLGTLAVLLLGLSSCDSIEQKTLVEIDTSMGKIKAELYADKAPITVKNFLQYVDDKHYDNTIFHRVIPTFMIQGGGFPVGSSKTAKTAEEFLVMEKKTREAIKNESSNGLKNLRGTLAMARTTSPHSATAQFFINTVDNGFLNKDQAQDGYGYCVFGKVIDGMDVVDKIKDVKTGKPPETPDKDVPLEEVIINSVRRVDR